MPLPRNLPPDPLTSLRSLADRAYDPLFARRRMARVPFWGDELLADLEGLSNFTLGKLDLELPAIFPKPKFSVLFQNPMVNFGSGSFRTSPTSALDDIFRSALIKMHLLHLPIDKQTFISTVIEGYQELTRAINGEKVTGFLVSGIYGISLSKECEICTPWGILRSAPSPINKQSPNPIFGEPRATCTLVQEYEFLVRFSDSSLDIRSEDVDTQKAHSRGLNLLLPLSCILALYKSKSFPPVPIARWSSSLIPFSSPFGSVSSAVRYPVSGTILVDDHVSSLESMSRILEKKHPDGLDVSAIRLVSSVSRERNKSDSLIDAVIVWENLFGADSEVQFRVTASLAKWLESDISKRQSFQKQLKEVYDVRSRIVHGGTVKPDKLNEVRETAVDVGIRALRKLYICSEDWLSMESNDRSKRILLGG